VREGKGFRAANVNWGVRGDGDKERFWVEWEMGCDMEYSLMECLL